MVYQKEIFYVLDEHDQEQELVFKSSGKVHFEDDDLSKEQQQPKNSTYKREIIWKNVVIMATVHLAALYGLTQLARAMMPTVLFTVVLIFLAMMGVVVGSHRFWSHKSFKANVGVRLFLAFCHVLALQNDLYQWCRDHRAHHRFADTDADPHSSSRGFFYSHVGWLLVKKHPEVLRRGKNIDLSDLMADPVVRFQRRYYVPLAFLFWGFLPTFIPVYFWGESVLLAFLICVLVRYAYSLNNTWLVNSWAHMYGYRPYDGQIAAVEACYIRHIFLGEGYHNFHHAFPWDYSGSELGPATIFSLATALIDFFALFGWVWDRKQVSPQLMKAKMTSKGDGSVQLYRTPSAKALKNVLIEWTFGLCSLFGPLLLVRYIAGKVF